ncbi:unnamed protein product [Rhizophagus irregularis]|nr:unnamed protein product [Rhizophagus irregularis]CAB5355544.1 unnamed protein product [Rhizophagus irregularis]
MRKQYTHNIIKEPEQRYWIRNRFMNRTITLATSSTAASSRSNQTSIQISPPLPNDDDNMEVRYNYEDDDMVPQYDTVSQYEYDNDDMEYDDDMNSQYEYNDDDMIVFDSYEEDDEDDEEGEGEEWERRGEEEEEETEEGEEDHHHQIVDEAFDKDKMSSYNDDGEFAPYFENFTTASLFFI